MKAVPLAPGVQGGGVAFPKEKTFSLAEGLERRVSGFRSADNQKDGRLERRELDRSEAIWSCLPESCH